MTPHHWKLLQEINKCKQLDTFDDLLQAKTYGLEVEFVLKIVSRDTKQRNLLQSFKQSLNDTKLEVKYVEGAERVKVLDMNEAVLEILEEQTIEISKLARTDDIDLEIGEQANELSI